MKRTKRILATAVAAVLALTCCLFAAGCKKDPIKTLEKAIGTTAGVLESNPSNERVKAFEDGFTIEMDAPVGSIAEALAGSEAGLGGTEIDALLRTKMYSKSSERALELNLMSGGETVADALAYENGDYIAISSESLLDEAYGLLSSGQKEKFDKSAFGMNGSFSLGMEYEDLTNLLFSGSSDSSENSAAEELNRKSAEYIDSEFELLKKYGKAEMTDGTLAFEDENVKTTYISFTLSGEELFNLTKESVDLSIDFMNELISFAELNSIGENDDAIVSLRDELVSMKESFNEDAEEIRDNCEKTVLTLAFHIAKSNEIIGLDFNIDATENEEIKSSVSANFAAGPSLKTPSCIKAKVVTEENGEAAELLSFNIDIENGDSLLKGTIELSSEGESIASGVIEYNRETGEYSAEIDSMGEKIAVNGTMTIDENVFKYTVDTVETGTSGVVELGISFTLKPGAEIPKITEYRDILDLTEEEVESIVNSVSQEAMLVLYKIMGLM